MLPKKTEKIWLFKGELGQNEQKLKVCETVLPKKAEKILPSTDQSFSFPILWNYYICWWLSQLYRRLEHENPRYRDKMAIVCGSLEEPNLGLSIEDRRKLTREVNVIFHCAATVRFDEKLSIAASINLQGTREMLKLAREMKNLKVNFWAKFWSNFDNFC